MIENYRPIIWKNNKLYLLDQRLLPHSEKYLEFSDLDSTAKAINDMVVRGAPCIGFTAIYGLALWVSQQTNLTLENCRKACDFIISSRPTAVNLSFEVNRCFELIKKLIEQGRSLQEVYKTLIDFAGFQINQIFEKNTFMAKIAFEELKHKIGNKKWKLMTHCNTGFLACGSSGTALGVISHAHKMGNIEHVIVDETRPYLQGSRLTAFELSKEEIPYHIVVEGAASYLLSQNKVDAIFVGADRIAENGDTANKVGTSTLAIVANYYKIPFYVVAPVSSFDTSIPDGTHIAIEMRSMTEVTEFNGINVAPENSSSINPSFDITEHSLISGIICEKGLINPKNKGELKKVVTS